MKILLSKPGLDGHDVGVKVLAHAIKNAGYEVAYTGLRKSMDEIVEMAKNIDADVIGLSILSGTHLILCQRMEEIMNENDLDIPWLAGGNIPHGDVDALLELGATAAFPTGTTVEEVVEYLKKLNSK